MKIENKKQPTKSNMKLSEERKKKQMESWLKIKKCLVNDRLTDFWTNEMGARLNMTPKMVSCVMQMAVKNKLVKAKKMTLERMSAWEIEELVQ